MMMQSTRVIEDLPHFAFLHSILVLAVFSRWIHLLPASNPYPGNTIDITRTLALVTAQIFRAEFDQFAAGSFPGPRVRELDAIITAVPVPAAVWLFASGLTGLIGIQRRHINRS